MAPAKAAVAQAGSRVAGVANNVATNMAPVTNFAGQVVDFLKGGISQTRPIQPTPPRAPMGGNPAWNPSPITVPGSSLSDILQKGIPIDPQKLVKPKNPVDISGTTGSPGRTTVTTPDPSAVAPAIAQDPTLFDELYAGSSVAGIPITGSLMPQEMWDMPQAGAVDLGTDIQQPDPGRRISKIGDFLSSPEFARALGQFAQAIGGPDSVGGRLGAIGEGAANANIEQNVLERMLGGEAIGDIKGRGTSLAPGGLDSVLEKFNTDKEMRMKESENKLKMELGEQQKTLNILGMEKIRAEMPTTVSKAIDLAYKKAMTEYQLALADQIRNPGSKGSGEQSPALYNSARTFAAMLMYPNAQAMIQRKMADAGLEDIGAFMEAMKGPDGSLDPIAIYGELSPEDRDAYNIILNRITNSSNFTAEVETIGKIINQAGGITPEAVQQIKDSTDPAKTTQTAPNAELRTVTTQADLADTKDGEQVMYNGQRMIKQGDTLVPAQ
jgi:hypothetical protein